MPDESASRAPEVAPGLTAPQIIDLVEWLQVDHDMTLGQARSQGAKLGVQITRRQFWDARTRIGLTSRAAPHPDRRRKRRRRAAQRLVTEESVPVNPPKPPAPSIRRRRKGTRVRLNDVASLVRDFQAVAEERDRARAAIEEIARVLKAIR